MPTYHEAPQNAVVKAAPEKKAATSGGGKGRPQEGKMFPRGTGK